MTDSTTRIDQSQPSIARVYDYLLGGKDNYAVDREVGDFFKKDLPGSVAIAHSNRQALIRSVAAMSHAGIRQFIDLGSGLPSVDNVHQVAQRHDEESRVVYVDIDPIVLAHSRALLATDGATTVITADLREPETIRAHPEVERLIDFTQPVGVVFSAILHHLNDDEDPAGVVRYWASEVPAGSHIYISHFRSGDNEETRAAEAKLQTTFGRGRWRNDDEIRSLFGDLEILDPGLRPCVNWWPQPEPGAAGLATIGAATVEPTVWQQLIAAAYARKN